jgi:hypothetical protein
MNSVPLFTYVNREDRWLTPAEGKAVSEGKSLETDAPKPDAPNLNPNVKAFLQKLGQKQEKDVPDVSAGAVAIGEKTAQGQQPDAGRTPKILQLAFVLACILLFIPAVLIYLKFVAKNPR